MIKAAGILIVTAAGNALFLQRSATASDFPGFWDFPGGTQEGDETAEATAARECVEEIGLLPPGTLRLHTRTTNPHVDFSTFLLTVAEEFVPELNDEHVGYAWAPVDKPPETIHPGARIALSRLSMDELGVARAIAAGELVSPQPYHNMWLFALRITGTGTAYRTKHDEFVYRPPENYLSEEFLARCNGLTVIYMHPDKSLLNSQEFGERVVGSILLPYIVGDEVWGVAKIYDRPVAELMEAKQLSTSPAVFFGYPGGSGSKLTLGNGSKLLIEGKPSLLDHLAICANGVWDKGGGPTGVRLDDEARGDTMPKYSAEQLAAMSVEDRARADAEMVEEKKKADEVPDQLLAKLDAFMTKADDCIKRMDSVTTRMDAFDAKEKERMDAEEEEKKKADAAKADAERAAGDPERLAADKARKDAEEAEEKKKVADAAAALRASDAAAMGDVRKRIDEVAALIPKNPGDVEYEALMGVQAHADSVYSAFGKPAPRPLNGEAAPAYRRRILKDLKQHSKAFKDVDVSVYADDALKPIEDQIFADATHAANNPVVAPGVLMARTRRDSTGRNITDFFGAETFMHSMSRAPQFVSRFQTRNSQ